MLYPTYFVCDIAEDPEVALLSIGTSFLLCSQMELHFTVMSATANGSLASLFIDTVCVIQLTCGIVRLVVCVYFF